MVELAATSRLAREVSDSVTEIVGFVTLNSLTVGDVVSTDVSSVGTVIADSLLGFTNTAMVVWLVVGASSAVSITIDEFVDAEISCFDDSVDVVGIDVLMAGAA
ncbi:MAG: hypothetical protein Fur006_27040 [Coleofasciculaceae cyanobacterium]